MLICLALGRCLFCSDISLHPCKERRVKFSVAIYWSFFGICAKCCFIIYCTFGGGTAVVSLYYICCDLIYVTVLATYHLKFRFIYDEVVMQCKLCTSTTLWRDDLYACIVSMCKILICLSCNENFIWFNYLKFYFILIPYGVQTWQQCMQVWYSVCEVCMCTDVCVCWRILSRLHMYLCWSTTFD